MPEPRSLVHGDVHQEVKRLSVQTVFCVFDTYSTAGSIYTDATVESARPIDIQKLCATQHLSLFDMMVRQRTE